MSIAAHVILLFSQELLWEHLGVHVRSNGLLLADLCRERAHSQSLDDSRSKDITIEASFVFSRPPGRPAEAGPTSILPIYSTNLQLLRAK